MSFILLVGTRKTTLDSLSEMIRSHGYELSIARNQRSAHKVVRDSNPDLIILDNTSARLAGPKLSHTLRHLVDTPLIAIVRTHEELAALNSTHSLVKPYSVQELLDCIREALSYPRYLICGALKLDLRTRLIYAPHEHEPQHLPPKQFALLRLLMQNYGRTLSREIIMSKVWDTEFTEDTRTLDVHIRWIREKIEVDPSAPHYLHTIRGNGYCLGCGSNL